MNSTTDGQPLPKKDRREQARQKARIELERNKKRERRSRWLWRGGIALGFVAIITVIALIIAGGTKSASVDGPLNMASDGIVLTGDGSTITAVQTPARPANDAPIPTDLSALTSSVDIVTYVDYLCPYCGQFERTNGAQIENWVKTGEASLEVHPISILNSISQGTEYSTRSANAAACVANFQPDTFLAVNQALFADQPQENSPGLTDEELVSLVQGAGATDSQIESCITDQTFSPWVTDATSRALAGPLPNANISRVEGTPTVLVNGVAYQGSFTDPAAFQSFVLAQAAAGLEPTPTPTPTPTG